MGFWSDYRSGQQGGEIIGAAVVGFFLAIFAVTKKSYIYFYDIFYPPNYREYKETLKLYEEVKLAFDASDYANLEDMDGFIRNLITEVALRAEVSLPDDFYVAFWNTTHKLIEIEGTLYGWFYEEFVKRLYSRDITIEEGVDLRNALRSQQYFLNDSVFLEDEWKEKLISTYVGILNYLPDYVFSTSEDQSGSIPTTSLISLVHNPAEVVQRLIFTFLDDDVIKNKLFQNLRENLDRNIHLVSNVNPKTQKKETLHFILPTSKNKNLTRNNFVDDYLSNTPFQDFFEAELPFIIQQSTRFQHHHIVSPPGTGKSTTLQTFLSHDLDLVADDKASVIVMDSNRDLFYTLSRLKRFAPDGDLAGKLISIDVEDVEWPISINLFNLQSGTDEELSPRDKEVLLNSATSMLDYIFRALIGAEMTSRQSTLFNFTIQLLMQIPNATLDTFIDLMEPNGLEKYSRYLDRLDSDARRFFEMKFNSDELRNTKSQVVDRMFGIKRIRALSRILSATETKLNLFEELQSSKVVLINSAKALLQEDGTEIFSRFFLANILLAVEKRQMLPKSERLPTFLYIDECQDVIRQDDKLPIILDQARKLNVACILAHQRLNQMTPPVLDALMGSTAIKFTASLAEAGANMMARNMNTKTEFIINQPKYSYAVYIRGQTDTAISLKMPFTDFNELPKMTDQEALAVKEEMRRKYATRYTEVQQSQLPEEDPDHINIEPS